MTLAQLTSFVEVAHALSFRRAAERLHLAQPSVSAHIRELERELRVSLFDRLGHRVRLTQAGTVLLEHAERVLLDVAEARVAVDTLSGAPQGLLALGTTPTLVATMIPPVVRQLHLDAPAVSLRLSVGVSEVVITGLRRGDFDLGVAYVTHPEPALTVMPLMDDEFILVVRSDHPLAERGIIPVHELDGMSLIALEADTAGRIVMDRELGRRGILPAITMELASSEAIKGMVAAGVGAAIVSRLAVRWELQMGLIHEVPIEGVAMRHPVAILTRARHTLSGPVRAGLAALRTVYKE